MTIDGHRNPSVDELRRALNGDRSALRSVVDCLTPVIQVRVARALLRLKPVAYSSDIRQEVADLTQQVFLALFADQGKTLRSWDPDRGASLAGFVGLLAEREVISTMRTQSRNPWSEIPMDLPDLDRAAGASSHPEAGAASREVLDEVWKRLQSRLTNRGVQMFQWLYVDGLSVGEVCTLTGLTEDAVHAWRSRLGRLVRDIAGEVMSDSLVAERTAQERTP